MPQYALVREPGTQYAHCISSHPLHHTVNITRARAQHAAYTNTLAELGIEIIRLFRDDKHPDACFVEDTAVIYGGKALIGRLAKNSRRGDEDSVEEALQEYLPVKRILAPGTLEGGDVIQLPTESLVESVSEPTGQVLHR